MIVQAENGLREKVLIAFANTQRAPLLLTFTWLRGEHSTAVIILRSSVNSHQERAEYTNI
jgi:hypothetical protein